MRALPGDHAANEPLAVPASSGACDPDEVYTVYAPQHHKPGKVHQTKAIADTDTDDEPADWSVQPDPVADQHA